MDLEPKTLGMPQRKKDMSSYWFALTCIGLGAVAIRPTRSSEWIVALGIVGPTFWVTFGGPSFINHWQNNVVPIVRGLVFLSRIAFTAVVLWYVVPSVVAAVDALFPT